MRVRLLTLLAVYAALFMNAAAVADEAVYQSSGEPRSVDEILLSLPGGRDAGTVVPLSMRPLIFSKFHIPGRMPGAECPVSQNVLRQACLSATESYAGGLPGADSDSVFTDIMRRYMLSKSWQGRISCVDVAGSAQFEESKGQSVCIPYI